MLARDGREGLEDRGRSYMGGMAQLLREPAARLRDLGLVGRLTLICLWARRYDEV